MKLIVTVLLLSLVAISCANHQVPSKLPLGKPKIDSHACKNACLMQLKTGTVICENSCAQCAFKEDRDTEKRYAHYRRELCVKNGYIARDLSSYRDVLKCHNVSCDCSSDYTLCMQQCNGKILKRLKPRATCC